MEDPVYDTALLKAQESKIFEAIVNCCENNKQFIANGFKELGRSNGTIGYDKWAERCTTFLLNKQKNELSMVDELYNERIVSDEVRVCNDCVIFVDSKCNNSTDNDQYKNNLHLGINQCNWGGIYIKPKPRVHRDPHETSGPFLGFIKPFYKEKPTFTYFIKYVYKNTQENTDILTHLQIYLIPHRYTRTSYEGIFRKGKQK
jgi:hypothetical protein